MKGGLLALFVAVLCALSARAHEVRPAYLELKQKSADTFEVLWKVPGRGDEYRLGLHVELPAGSTNLSVPRTLRAGNAFTDRWTVRRAGGLEGETIRIGGLSATMTDVLVRYERLAGSTQIARLTPSTPSFVVESAPRALTVARTYLGLGVEHILLGIDHLLFVFALLLIVGHRWMTLLKTVTAFTVAHSITLALAALGVVHVPQAPVEAVIALSIMFVASEILHTRAGRPGLTARAPWIVAFVFGLLHGFGFAGALSEIGLPQGQIPVALLLFNVGVEAGQLLFVAAVVAAITLINRFRVNWPRWTGAAAPYAIGALSAFWFIERMMGIVSGG